MFALRSLDLPLLTSNILTSGGRLVLRTLSPMILCWTNTVQAHSLSVTVLTYIDGGYVMGFFEKSLSLEQKYWIRSTTLNAVQAQVQLCRLAHSPDGGSILKRYGRSSTICCMYAKTICKRVRESWTWHGHFMCYGAHNMYEVIECFPAIPRCL